MTSLSEKLKLFFGIQDEKEKQKYLHANKSVLDWVVENLSNPGATDTGYEQNIIDLMNVVNVAVMNAVIEQVPVEKGSTIMEIGVGGGKAFRQIAEKLANAGGGKLIALDISTKCLDTTRVLMNQDNWSEKNVTFEFVNGGVGMDVVPKIASNSVDTIYHSNCWYFWPDLRKGAQQCFSFLAKNGRMISGSKTATLEKLFGPHRGSYDAVFKHTRVSLLEEAMKSAKFNEIQTEIGDQDIPHTVTSGLKIE